MQTAAASFAAASLAAAAPASAAYQGLYDGLPPEVPTRPYTVRGKVSYPLQLPEEGLDEYLHPDRLTRFSHDSSSLLSRGCSALTMGVVATWAKAVLSGLNRFTVFNRERLVDLVEHRPAGQPLITISNHTSTLDDPVIVSNLLPLRLIASPTYSRWSWCAKEICFKNLPVSVVSHLGRAIPVKRGSGLWQAAMLEAQEHVRNGKWVHVFPEGRVMRDEAVGTLRWGAAKLIADASRAGLNPVVLPWVHRGMEGVMPSSLGLPRAGNEVFALVGEPIRVDDLVAAHARAQALNQGHGDPFPPPDEMLYVAITNRLQTELQRLDHQLTRRLHPEVPELLLARRRREGTGAGSDDLLVAAAADATESLTRGAETAAAGAAAAAAATNVAVTGAVFTPASRLPSCPLDPPSERDRRWRECLRWTEKEVPGENGKQLLAVRDALQRLLCASNPSCSSSSAFSLSPSQPS